jgi:membrane protease YdiL (CAAX protease family)
MSILPEPAADVSTDRPGTLFGILLAAFVAYWVVTPAIYQLATGQTLAPATQSTTQPFPQISPRDLVALSVLTPIVGCITLFAGNLLWIKRPFEKLGLTWDRLHKRGWMIGIISAVLIVPAIAVVNLLSEKFWDLIHYAHPDEHALLQALGEEPSKGVRAAIAVSAIILAPLFEEFFFRGMLQRALRMVLGNAWSAILIASIMFTAVHGAIWMVPPIFALSLCLGYLYERTKNLWVTIIVHALFNASSIVVFLFFR